MERRVAEATGALGNAVGIAGCSVGLKVTFLSGSGGTGTEIETWKALIAG